MRIGITLLGIVLALNVYLTYRNAKHIKILEKNCSIPMNLVQVVENWADLHGALVSQLSKEKRGKIKRGTTKTPLVKRNYISPRPSGGTVR